MWFGPMRFKIDFELNTILRWFADLKWRQSGRRQLRFKLEWRGCGCGFRAGAKALVALVVEGTEGRRTVGSREEVGIDDARERARRRQLTTYRK